MATGAASDDVGADRCGDAAQSVRLFFTHSAILRKMAFSHAVPSLNRAVPSGLGLA